MSTDLKFGAKETSKFGTPRVEGTTPEVGLKPKADIISATVNVTVSNLEWFLKQFGGITIPYKLELKEINPDQIVSEAADADKLVVEDMVKKIVAFSADNSYLGVVPCLVVGTSYLREDYADPNITKLGVGLAKETTAPVKSPFVVEYINERTSDESEVHLDTATIIAKTLCLMLGVEYNLLLTKKYSIIISFNNKDAYTATIRNNEYVSVK